MADKSKPAGYRIEDIANELGLNKSTVSRAISGKGRISEETRSLVNSFIKEHGIKLNSMARGLAQRKTFNIGLALYDDCDMGEVPFFQKCAYGICTVAGRNDYDVVLFHVDAEDLSNLDRIIVTNKIDGIILTRTAERDPAIRTLRENHIPFVVIGSSDDENVVHIDEDHVSACRELTKVILASGSRKLLLLGGQMKLFVNKNRLKGFQEAVGQNSGVEWRLRDELKDITEIERAVEEGLGDGTDCIICMDDYICSMTLACLAKSRVRVPEDISLATFYSSIIISNNSPEVAGIRFDAEKLGQTACETLLDMLAGKPGADYVSGDYRLIPGASLKIRE